MTTKCKLNVHYSRNYVQKQKRFFACLLLLLACACISVSMLIVTRLLHAVCYRVPNSGQCPIFTGWSLRCTNNNKSTTVIFLQCSQPFTFKTLLNKYNNVGTGLDIQPRVYF